jgi:heptaprenyl diphosphate synthase
LADDFHNLATHRLKADAERLKRLRRDTFALVNEAEQDVLGADVVVIEEPSFFLGQNHDPTSSVGKALEQGITAFGRNLHWSGRCPESVSVPFDLRRVDLTYLFGSRFRSTSPVGAVLSNVAPVAQSSPLLDLPSMVVDRARIERALLESVATSDELLTEMAGHLIKAGGKRLRPVMAVAAALTGRDVATDAVVRGGVAVELVQVGSLYHDDVMDEAEIRRGAQSANARWGNHRAILAGDFLLARASEIAASLGAEVAGLLGHTIGRLVEGQILELRTQFDATRTEASHIASIEGKSASLFAAAARIGGLVAELPRPHVDALTDCGLAYGMAFQLIDDILDLVADEQELGKPSGHDMVEGIYTLPVIHTLSAGGAAADALRSVLATGVNNGTVETALDLVRTNGGVRYAIDVARRYADDAAKAMVGIGDNAATHALAGAAHVLIDSVENR